MDVVFLRNLRFDLPVGPDAWQRKGKAQPIIVSLEIASGVAIRNAATGDDVSKALDYGKLYKLVHGKLTAPNAQFRDIQHLAESVRSCIASNVEVSTKIVLPKANLRSDGGVKYVRLEAWNNEFLQSSEALSIDGIRCTCIIGVNPHERLEKQLVTVDLSFGQSSDAMIETGKLQKLPIDRYNEVTAGVVSRVEGSAYQTLEALASAVAQTVTMEFAIGEVTVRAEKPNAIASIDAAGIQLRRTRSFFETNNFWGRPAIASDGNQQMP